MSTETDNAVWPTELTLNPAKDTLSVSFDNSNAFDLSAEYLRVNSPSAEVQGHSADQRKTVGGKKAVKITGLTPQGNYAVRIAFDDGHDTGLFTWTYLHELGEEFEERWTNYLTELAEKSMARE